MAEVVVEEEGTRYTQRIRAGRHALLGDEPAEKGGADRGPSPHDLLLSSLGACTAITLRMYADLKKIPLRRVTVRLRHEKVAAEEGKIDRIEREIGLDGDLSAEQRARLMEIADRCPVHKMLKGEVRIVSRPAPA